MSPADWDRLQYYSRRVKLIRINTTDSQIHPSTYIRIAQLQSSSLFPSLRHLHYNLDDMSIPHIYLFLSPLLDTLELTNIRGIENTIIGPFLATLPSPILTRIVLRSGQMSVDTLKDSIVHFKQLRRVELTDAVFMSDFVLWELLGTLPSLKSLTLKATDPASHPAHAPENSSSQSGGHKYFVDLEGVSVTGSLFLIQHLLGFIDSPCLKRILVYPVNPVRHELEDFLNLFMTIITYKWPHSLSGLTISSSGDIAHRKYAISRGLTLLTDLREMRRFYMNWRMDDVEDYVRCAVKSWPKIRYLRLSQTLISLSNLRIIAENCPQLRHLYIRLDTSTIPPFDTSSKRVNHNLKLLSMGEVHSSITPTTLKHQIEVTRHLDLIFPNLKSIKVSGEAWLDVGDLVKLCQDIRRAE